MIDNIHQCIHILLTNTIVDVSEKTTDIYKKIENGQEELTAIRDLSKDPHGHFLLPLQYWMFLLLHHGLPLLLY